MIDHPVNNQVEKEENKKQTMITTANTPTKEEIKILDTVHSLDLRTLT